MITWSILVLLLITASVCDERERDGFWLLKNLYPSAYKTSFWQFSSSVSGCVSLSGEGGGEGRGVVSSPKFPMRKPRKALLERARDKHSKDGKETRGRVRSRNQPGQKKDTGGVLGTVGRLCHHPRRACFPESCSL